jgi:hypothetical protein
LLRDEKSQSKYIILMGGEHIRSNKTRDRLVFYFKYSFIRHYQVLTIKISSDKESEIDISNLTSEVDVVYNSQLDTEL